MAQLSQLHVEALQAKWKKEVAQGTRRGHAFCLRKILAFLNRNDLQAEKVKRSHTRAAKAAPGEIDRLIAVSPPWLRCLLTIAALTGMRRGDCLALSPAHCDDDLTVISLTQAKTKIAVSLPVAPGLQAVLRDAPGPATSANIPYVDRYAGKPVTGSMVDNAMIDALEAIERRPAVDKSSTVTMSGKEILKQRKLTIGMDLGDRSSRYCVLDEAGDVILERSVARAKYPTALLLAGALP